MRITVILPTYNEAENLPGLVADIFSLPLDGLRVLVVDDNSPDGTGKVADGLASEYAGRLDVLHRTGKLGLGTAYILGFQHALASGHRQLLKWTQISPIRRRSCLNCMKPCKAAISLLVRGMSTVVLWTSTGPYGVKACPLLAISTPGRSSACRSEMLQGVIVCTAGTHCSECRSTGSALTDMLFRWRQRISPIAWDFASERYRSILLTVAGVNRRCR
jgi:cellulose synthase/poly-beta-1,6-N-acetylglucosamine synthase-like glycosyltransferase